MDKVYDGKNLALLAIICMIVIYIAVSVYGVIRDMATYKTIFMITSESPRTGQTELVTPILERVRGIFNPSVPVVVPVEKRVTIRGRVVYTNGTPYAYGMVELRSEPRITYTDGDGYFTFKDVEDGYHTISIFNQKRQIIASCTVTINRNIAIPDAVLVPISDNSFLLDIAVDVKVLEIELEIEQGTMDRPTGKLIIKPDVKVVERYIESDKIEENPKQGGIPEPFVPPEQPKPVNPPVGGGGGGGIPKPPPLNNELTVYSSKEPYTKFNQAPTAAACIDIFGLNKRITPGMSGVYQFTIDNTANNFAVSYNIDLEETNNSLNIPIRYRLKNNRTNSYVNGDYNWHTITEINEVTAKTPSLLFLNGSMKTDYTLEWLWDDGGINDNSYAEKHAGEVVCTLAIKVTAQKK